MEDVISVLSRTKNKSTKFEKIAKQEFFLCQLPARNVHVIFLQIDMIYNISLYMIYTVLIYHIYSIYKYNRHERVFSFFLSSVGIQERYCDIYLSSLSEFSSLFQQSLLDSLLGLSYMSPVSPAWKWADATEIPHPERVVL